MNPDVGNPPYCPKCGSSAQQTFVQISDKQTKQPTPFGVCRRCFEILRLIPLGDGGVAPFLERVSDLAAPAGVIHARTQIRMQIGSLQ